jgi:hypothetical protein
VATVIPRWTILTAATALGLGLGGAALPADAGAQSAAPAASCMSLAPAADSVDAMLHLSLGSWRPVWDPTPTPGPSAAEREALTLALQELRAAITLPRELFIRLSSETPFEEGHDGPHPTRPMTPELKASFALTLHRDGRISDLEYEKGSISKPLDEALVAMLQRVDSTRTLENLAGSIGDDPVRLRLAVTTSPGPRQVAAPLVRLRLPVFRGTPAVHVSGRAPEYPEVARLAGVSDTVVMQFVVDTLGRVELGTAQVLAVRYRWFVQEVLRALPELRFRPMQVAGCPIRQVAIQPFVFSLR